MVKVLAGNKCEASPTQRVVDKERGMKVNASNLNTHNLIFNAIHFPFSHSQIAENFDMPFFEVSCKQNINIEEAFLTLARKIREQREQKGNSFDDDDKPKSKRSPGSNGLGPFSLGGSNGESGRCSC